MPLGQLQKWMTDVRAQVEQLRGDPQRWKVWRQVHPAKLTLDYADACFKGEWDKLATHAGAEVAARRAGLAQLEQQQTGIAELARHGATLAAAAKGVKLPRSKDPAWSAMRAAAATGLDAEGKRALDELGSMTVAKLAAGLTAIVEGLTEELDVLARAQLVVLGRVTLAHGVARFNQRFAAGSSAGGDGLAMCKRVEQKIAAAERSLWSALKQGDLVAAKQRGADLSQAARAAFDEALGHAVASAKARRAAFPTLQQGRLGTRLGVLLNASLRATALGDHASWVAGSPVGLPAPKRWIDAARKLPFPSAAVEPPLRPIEPLGLAAAGVAGTTPPANGEAMTIEGAVTAMQMARQGAKDVYAASVSDGKTGVVIRTEGVPLDRGGLVPGAYVRLSGTWVPSWLGLRVATLSRAALAKQGWSDWVSTELEGLAVASSDLVATWSWEPGDDGAANAVEYGLGG